MSELVKIIAHRETDEKHKQDVMKKQRESNNLT